MSKQVLVIDDDDSMCEVIQAALREHRCEVDWRTSAEEALELITARDYDILVTDMNLGSMSGLKLCQRVTETRPDMPVIVITAFGNMDTAIEAIRAGAYDYINKPLDMAALAHTIERAVQHRELREEVKRLRERAVEPKAIGEMIGESPAMKRVYDLVLRVSDTDTSVLLTGESGTGKEIVARALHAHSHRADRPFIAINCAAVPANLLESELFGHARGAFTDAKASRTGLFEQANGGTILLDEIAEMAEDMQAKLLRVLQDRKVRPVGANKEIAFDARVIASTNRDLESEVEDSHFREDLYYRLNVVQIHLPPLRSRSNDVLLLAQRFIEKFAGRLDKPVQGISSEAAHKLLEYDWPGNVRELENCIERAVTLTRFDQITVDDLPDKIRDYESSKLVLMDSDAEHMLTIEELEKRYIERVLKATDGNKTQAAKILGLDRRTLYRKLDRYEQRAS